MVARQRRFVEEYLIDLNATQAAIRAGYSAPTAYSVGQRLTTYPHIKAAIERAIKTRSARTMVTQDRVLDELAVVAFSNIHDYHIDDNGHVELDGKARDDSIRAVASIKRKRRTISVGEDQDIVEVDTEIRLWDKPTALKMCGQHLGMFVEREPFLNPLDVARAVREAVRSMNAVDGLDAVA